MVMGLLLIGLGLVGVVDAVECLDVVAQVSVIIGILLPLIIESLLP